MCRAAVVSFSAPAKARPIQDSSAGPQTKTHCRCTTSPAAAREAQKEKEKNRSIGELIFPPRRGVECWGSNMRTVVSFRRGTRNETSPGERTATSSTCRAAARTRADASGGSPKYSPPPARPPQPPATPLLVGKSQPRKRHRALLGRVRRGDLFAGRCSRMPFLKMAIPAPARFSLRALGMNLGAADYARPTSIDPSRLRNSCLGLLTYSILGVIAKAFLEGCFCLQVHSCVH